MEARTERLIEEGRKPACLMMEAAIINLEGVVLPEPRYLKAVREITDVVAAGKVYQVRAYDGNALSMVAACASLEEVMTSGAYEHLRGIIMAPGRERVDAFTST